MNLHRPQRPGCSRFAAQWPATDGGVSLRVGRGEQISDATAALELIGTVASRRPTHETIAVLLDHEHRGSTVINVDGTFDNDSVLHVADLVTELAHRVEQIGAVIIASFRPGGSDDLDDVERWMTIDEQLSLVGVELVEWFVIGRSVSCPRSLLGDAARWAA